MGDTLNVCPPPSLRKKLITMLNIILQLGGFQALILGIMLYAKKANVRANSFLVVLLGLLGASCLLQSLSSYEFYSAFPHFIRLDWGIPLLFGPLLYFFILKITHPTFVLQHKDAKHLFPYIFNLVVLLPFLYNQENKRFKSLIILRLLSWRGRMLIGPIIFF